MDYILFLNILKNKMEHYEGNGQFDPKFAYLNDEIKTTTLNIQTQLIKKLIIPYFENKQQNNSENFDKALK